MPAATFGSERVMLLSLALAVSLTACQDLERATGPALSQSALPNSITLTYICGNSFRVRNTNPAVITVTWDVYKTTEQGTLTLAAKPAAAPYSEAYFTAINKGTVRLFLDGALIQTKANGNKPVCQLPADTTRPAVPAFGFPHDTAYLSTMASDSSIYYRRLVSVSFYPSASGSTINEFLKKYSAVIVGGRPSVDAYVVQVPDPGPSLDSLTALRSRMSTEPGVQFVILLTAHGPPPVVDARFPIDGSGFNRAGWGAEAGTDPLWALKSIRAPLAWGCETGTYGSVPVTVGVVEWGFRALHDTDDLPVGPEPNRRFASRTNGEPAAPGEAQKLAWHGTAVTGVLTAEGNNEGGVAGVTWRSSLYLYSLGTPTPTHPEDEYVALVDEIIPRLKADQPRVVNFSVELTKSSENPQRAAELSRALQALLVAAPSMLIVKSAGNDAYVVTPDALAALPGGSLLLLDALVRTRQAGFRDRVVIVGGSERSGDGVRVDTSLRFVDGETDIVAPARAVRVLGGSPFAADVVDTSGTSFAAPMVAGVAAQLLAMQPNLTPAQVKQYILEGAQEPRLDPRTGLIIGPEQLRLTRSGATQSVFQLDAYGALTLLSRRDPSTPICGLAVAATTNRDSLTQEWQTTVRIEGRPGVVYQGEPATVTVAQGGRRIGLDRGDGSLDLNLRAGAWEAGSTAAFRGIRQFLERDTAFIMPVNEMGEGVQIRGASRQGSPVFPCAAVTAGTDDVNFCRIGVVSNTGEWVHAVVERDNGDAGCGPSSSHFASYLVPLGGAAGGPTEIRNVRFEACRYFEPGSWSVPVADVVAWRADGSVAWVAQSDASLTTTVHTPDSTGGPSTYHSTITSMTTKFRQESVVSGVPAATARTVSGPAVYALGWRVDGRSLVSYDYVLESFDVCVRTVRAAEAPEVEVAGPVQFPPSYCGDRQMEPLPTSMRAPAPMGTGAAPAGLAAKATARRQWILRHAGPKVVLVN